MQNKLALRNAKRSIKDYLVYLLTMTAVAAMMFSFNSMIFSPDIKKMCTESAILAAMLGLAAFLIGLFVGTFLQQILMTIFYAVFSEEYSLNVQLNMGCLLMTGGCFFGCYLLALLRNKRIFKKMTIAELLRMEKENEKIKEGHERVKQILFFIAIGYILFVYGMMVHGCSIWVTLVLMAGFVAAVYFIFIGFSAFLVCRIKQKSAKIYHKERLFLYRQMSSKLKTMRFTMGTLTLLMVCALLGGAFSLMFAKYQSQAVDYSMPFDLLVHSPLPDDDFKEELAVVDAYNEAESPCVYQIYENATWEMNRYFCSHVSTVTAQYVDENGEIQLKNNVTREYYQYDTYMKLSDYNELRKLLGKETVTLEENQYLLQTKERIRSDMDEEVNEVRIVVNGKNLQLAEIETGAFSQNGINGADYLLVVPDNYVEQMTPYYSVLAAGLKEEGTAELRDKLDSVHRHKLGELTYDEYEKIYEQEEMSEDSEALGDTWKNDLLGAHGTDEIVVFIADIIVRDIDGKDMKFVVTSITFPLAYIALIFVCVALTILAVQQLSDAGKYRYRYQLLYKLGMKKREINHLVFRQISFYYLIPALVAAAISSVIAIYAGNQFVRYTGAVGNGGYYFGASLLLFFGIYLLYFFATYIGFKRNIC